MSTPNPLNNDGPLTIAKIRAISEYLRRHERKIIHGNYWFFAPDTERYLRSLWSVN